MANKRQRKKNTRKELTRQAQELGLSRVGKLSLEQLEISVTQIRLQEEAERKREEKNRRERERRARNSEIIKKYGLKGFKPSDSEKKIREAAAKAQKELDLAAAREIKARNEAILQNARISKENYPKGWTKKTESELQEWIEKYHSGQKTDRTKVLKSDVWLYIGWGDRAGTTDPYMWFSASGFYGGETVEDLRDGIRQTVKHKSENGGSSGRAGDVLIAYGDKGGVSDQMKWGEARGYQTIFFGNEISHGALMRYAAAAVDSCPEAQREYVVKQINGYLTMSGHAELKIKID